MYIAITRVAPELACTRCGSRNILIHSIYGGPLYGQYCSFDCRIAIRETDVPSPIAVPQSPACAPTHIVPESPDVLEVGQQQSAGAR